MRKTSKLLALTAGLSISAISLTASAAPPSFTDSTNGVYICKSTVSGVFATPTGDVYAKGPNLSSTGNIKIQICDSSTSGSCSDALSMAEAALLSGRQLAVKVIQTKVGTKFPDPPDCTALPVHPALEYVMME